MSVRLLITCEHGGNRIPAAYRELFSGHEKLLATHRGYDAGALTVARELARHFHAPLYLSTVSRLLIDLNRSIGHPKLYSEVTRPASLAVRHAILEKHYLPHRRRIEGHVASEIARGHRVIHIASHSFTPILDGEVRNADIGLLYNPARRQESIFCKTWQAALKAAAPGLRVRRNYPYQGKADGLTAYLRRQFADRNYAGIELEVNQLWVHKGGRKWREVRDIILRSLAQTIEDKI
jgi:predicted N-formylglutamate amidohydrolase